MKIFKNYIGFALFVITLVLSSCNDTYEFHEKYIEGGEITYSNKTDSLSTYSGNSRLKIGGYLSNAFNVNEIIVNWDKGQSSKTFSFTKSDNEIDELDLIIDGLEEKSYNFEVYTKDASGNTSVKTEIFGTAYGEIFRSNLEARGINATTYNGTDAEIDFGASNDEFQRNTEIKYTDNNSEEVIVMLAADESMIVLANASMATPVMYRTYYAPTLADEEGNETSIDLFPSDWKSTELVLTGSINFDKSDWVITDVSSEENGFATEAIDGDLNTFWHSIWSNASVTLPQYFTFDMGVEKTITAFEVFRRQGNGTGQTKHKFHVSIDGVNWTDLGEYTMDPTINDGQMFNVAPVNARYVKYEATEGPNSFAFLAEINVIERIDNAGWVITDVSSEENGFATEAIDGNLNTFWHSIWSNASVTLPQSFTFDMGVEKTITAFEVFRRQGNGTGQTKHKFHVSNDGINWTDLGEYTMDPTINDGQVFNVTPVNARYVKYEATEGPNSFAFLAEINILGY